MTTIPQKPSRLTEIKHSIIMLLFFVGILLPLRLAFVNFVGDNWLGSFGLITAVVLLVTILAEKNKLGNFGKIFIEQFRKIHRGKRRILAYTTMVFWLIVFSTIIHSINYGYHFKEEVQNLKFDLSQQNINDMQDIMENSKNAGPEAIGYAFLAIPYVIIFHYDYFSINMATINDYSKGWLLHFATIILVEQLEIVDLLVYFRIKERKEIAKEA